MNQDKLLSELLSAWEETYKKGQLTLWIFLALKEDKKYVDEAVDALIAGKTVPTAETKAIGCGIKWKKTIE